MAREILRAIDAEDGVVISHSPPDRIPEAVEPARKLGMRSQHYGWPGMTRTSGGDVLVSASERIVHVDPFGREVIVRSTNGGRTWTEPYVVFDSILDDRDASLCTLHDGTVVQSWFTSCHRMWENLTWVEEINTEWMARARSISQDTIAALSRGWLRRSPDGGESWEKEVYPTIVGQHAGPTVLSDGKLIYLGPLRQDDGSTIIAATCSVDGAKTWSVVGKVPCERKRESESAKLSPTLNENHVVEVEPGHLLAAFRAEPKDGGLIHLSDSTDNGRTWTPARKLSTYGYPPHLIKLQSGVILLTFSDRRQPQSIRAIVSYDGGRTWDADKPILIREMPHLSDFGYPVSLELEPDRILTVYYSVVYPPFKDPEADNSNPNQSGILSTQWSLS
jgi:hypothetical protein